MIRKVSLQMLLLIALVGLGCNRAQPAAGPAKLPEVIVCNPVVQMVTDFEDFPGRIDAVNTVQVKARQVQGVLTEIHFVDGQEVQAGDLLAVIQQDPYKAQLKAAEAQVALNEAYLKIAQITLNRDKNSIVATTPLQIDQDQAMLEQSDANLKLARANLETARLNMGFTEVRSPIAGRLSNRYVDPGNVVIADTTVLTTVVSFDPVYVYFDIDERTMLRLERLSQETKIPVPWNTDGSRRRTGGVVAGIGTGPVLDRPGVPAAGLAAGGGIPSHLGMPVALGLADEEGYAHHGVINFADNVVNRQTGTLRIRGEFANSHRLLSPGMFCRVQVPIGPEHPAVLVPDIALSTDQGRKFLYVLNDDDETNQRDVKIGALHNGLRVVEGVKETERIVVKGLQRVKSGAKVHPKLEPAVAEKQATDMPFVTGQVGDVKSSGK